MADPNHPYHKRAPHGFEGQAFMTPMIEKHIGEPITPTENQYDTMDAESEHYWIEMKRRSSKYHYTDWFIQQDGWLIPCCKISRAMREKKTARFYYYWDKDNTLWYWDFNRDDLTGCKKGVPQGHYDKQEHVYLPHSLWRRVSN